MSWQFASGKLAAILIGCAVLGTCRGQSSASSSAQPVPAKSIVERGSAVPSDGPLRRVPLTAKGGVGFDDLWFSAALHAVIAPAGNTGCVELFDTASLRRTSLCGVAPDSAYAGGHGEGTTSADFAAGLLLAIDRTSRRLKVVDPKTKRVMAASALAAEPDYVRWVADWRELWVTEPDSEQIERFSLGKDNPPQLTAAGSIPVKGGPESLVIDDSGRRAFTHLWQGQTVQIDLVRRAVSSTFPNGCRGSRGIALDPRRGQLFVGCSEGKVVVLDVNQGGKVMGSARTPGGVDIISVNLSLHHIYVPAASDGSVTVFGVTTRGKLSKLGQLHADKGAHCVISDDQRRVWVCSPESGSVLVFDDRFAPTVE